MTKPYIPTNRMAVAALVLGACSLVTVIIPFLNFFVLLMGPLGIIFGFVAILQLKQHPGEMKGGWQALTGILLSLSATILVAAALGLVLMMV
jgi:hypothetical protein